MSTRLCSFFVFVVVAGWLPAVAAGSVHNCGGAAAAALLAASSADNAAARVRAPAALAAPVFKHPWVQENVAVTFNAAVTKDGLGSQVHRLFGARAVAACTGLPFIHTSGFTRFAHLNGSASRHAAARVNTMLGLPMQPVAANASRHVVQLGRDCAVTWDTLAADTRAALAARRPTLFNISFTYGFALTHPGMLACVPVFRQHSPAACASNALMRPIRVAVHIRAGDAENDGRRLLPHAYFFAIIRAITKELRRLRRDYVVEVYTQAEYGIAHAANGTHHRISGTSYRSSLSANIGPHMLLLADMDVVWSLGQMATADVFVHSKSTLSIVAGIINTRGINIAPPRGSLPWPWLQASHWYHAANTSGTFDGSAWQQLAWELQSRFGPQCPGHLEQVDARGAARARHNGGDAPVLSGVAVDAAAADDVDDDDVDAEEPDV